MKKDKLVIGLVQINERKEGMARSGHQRDSKNQLLHEVATYPYSVGLLQAHTQKYYQGNADLQFLLPIYKRVAVEDAVMHLKEANIVGFSAYVWNINLSLSIAKALKTANPEICIVFGGPHVPDHAMQFLIDHPYIDMTCHGEGEQVFLQIAEKYNTPEWKKIPSISFLDEQYTFHRNPRIVRTKELSTIPSPYLEGTFTPLREANPQTSWIMLWETNRGCPFSCSYCDWGSAVGTKVNKFDDTRLYRELEWFAKTGGDIIFCCDANFGMLPRDIELAEFTVLIKKIYKHPRILTVQNAKNATEKSYKVQTLLATSRLNPVVTLSVQSVNKPTLEAIKRQNISLETFRELQRRFTKDKVLTYTDVILGMPHETYDTFFDGISTIIAGGQHHRILFYNLSILPNAEMGDPAYQQKYGLKTVPQLIQNLHSHLYEIEECEEFIPTVIETDSMNALDWRKSKCVWWITEMLYYNFILKLPISILNNTYGLSYRQLLEVFLYTDDERFPVFALINGLMNAKAVDIQNGGKEFYPSEEWLQIFWTTEQYIWIKLMNEHLVDDFYKEAEIIFCELLHSLDINYDASLVAEACDLNRQLIVRPQDTGNSITHVGTWNILKAFEQIQASIPTTLIKEEEVIEINSSALSFEEWLEHEIVCQNSKFKQWSAYTVVEKSTVFN